MRVLVSGKTFHACLDPTATDFFKDHPEIAQPSFVRRGKGFRADFGDLPAPHLQTLLWRLADYVDAFLGGGVDEYTKAEGRAILRDLERLRAEAKDQGLEVD